MKDEIVLFGIVLSDMVIREMNTGKVSYIGSFHQYNSPVFPFGVPPFSVTPIMTNFRGKKDKPIIIAIRIEDPKTGLISANVVAGVQLPPDYVFSGSEVLEFPFPIQPITFQSPGNYLVVIMLDGEKIGDRQLPVTLMTGQAQPQPPKS